MYSPKAQSSNFRMIGILGGVGLFGSLIFKNRTTKIKRFWCWIHRHHNHRFYWTWLFDRPQNHPNFQTKWVNFWTRNSWSQVYQLSLIDLMKTFLEWPYDNPCHKRVEIHPRRVMPTPPCSPREASKHAFGFKIGLNQKSFHQIAMTNMSIMVLNLSKPPIWRVFISESRISIHSLKLTK